MYVCMYVYIYIVYVMHTQTHTHRHTHTHNTGQPARDLLISEEEVPIFRQLQLLTGNLNPIFLYLNPKP
jgi:hypothetical protein